MNFHPTLDYIRFHPTSVFILSFIKHPVNHIQANKRRKMHITVAAYRIQQRGRQKAAATKDIPLCISLLSQTGLTQASSIEMNEISSKRYTTINVLTWSNLTNQKI